LWTEGGEDVLKKRLFSVILIITLFSASFIGIHFVSTASAKPLSIIYGVTPAPASKSYQEVVGELDGSPFLLRFPYPTENWNGKLYVYCHGWNDGVEPAVSSLRSASVATINGGGAFAASTFGEGGYPIQKAVIRTHQLTEWVIDNFDVEGKVFLIGISMGGNVALQLGAKYPDLYSGVLDVCGSKDLTDSYNKRSWANLNDAALAVELEALGPTPAPPPTIPFSIRYYPCTSLEALRVFVTNRAEDLADECGGPPTEKPKAYEKISPLYSATNLQIPVITIHGTLDGVVSLSQSLAYQIAVAEAGNSGMYRLYIVPGGGHASSSVMMQVSTRMPELVTWSDAIDPP
jgi:pimeloyl-ACP methyl ester carboxylesterase